MTNAATQALRSPNAIATRSSREASWVMSPPFVSRIVNTSKCKASATRRQVFLTSTPGAGPIRAAVPDVFCDTVGPAAPTRVERQELSKGFHLAAFIMLSSDRPGCTHRRGSPTTTRTDFAFCRAGPTRIAFLWKCQILTMPASPLPRMVRVRRFSDLPAPARTPVADLARIGRCEFGNSWTGPVGHRGAGGSGSGLVLRVRAVVGAHSRSGIGGLIARGQSALPRRLGLSAV